MSTSRYRIGIMGATGYTGSELVRILSHHPQVELAYITSESRQGESFAQVHPAFQGIAEHTLISAESVLKHPEKHPVDLLFLALPHGVSMDYVKRLHAVDYQAKIVDFSGDFRLSSPEVYNQWYPKAHHYAEGFDQAVYGLPEYFRNTIREAQLVANPGCFPTTTLLALAPLLNAHSDDQTPWKLSDQFCIVDAKTGVTGAGVKASATTHFANVHDNFKAYGVKTHRHSIEIQEMLERHGPDMPTVQFTPHLLPVDRGIFATLYLRLQGMKAQELVNQPESALSELKTLYRTYYAAHPFVRLCDRVPTLKSVRGSNYCHLYLDWDARTGNLILMSVTDNLVKGAAGQAVQNMNLMLGLEETTGLQHIPLSP